jgi:Uma2 family endonuclease
MGLPKLKTKISVEDYLEGEKISPVKHEYVDGVVYAMAGTSDTHNLIAGDIYIALGVHLRGSRCQPFSGEIKVQVTRNVYYYPDILVSCEENPESAYFRNAPILIIEITSPSTATTDRREKLFLYRQMPSLQEYAIVDQHRVNIELHRRQPNGTWITYFFDASDDEVEFQSVGLTMPIPEIYRRVRFKNNADTDIND